MVRFLRLTAVAASAALALPATAQIVIAHRGASGERPEHTLAAYERAIDQKADFIEPDLVPTRDGHLVARHENEISQTTDVSAHREFSRRKRTRVIDGEKVSGWFTEDFTLAELRTLRARERLPAVRPNNARFDGLFQVPSFAEVARLAKARAAETGRPVGLYPELKHPVYFKARGIDLPAMLLKALADEGLDGGSVPVFIQCFEVGALRQLRGQTRLPLVQLIAAKGGPADRPDLTYASMTTPDGLREIATYANAIGVEMQLAVGPDGKKTALVDDAHAAGLKVHVWTLRRENQFLPPLLRSGTDPAAPGNFPLAWQILRSAGVDGVFTDNPGSVPRR